jgi:hypothetical protein
MSDPTDEAAPRRGLVDTLGPRAERRAEPRATVALAGAGSALAVIGVLLLSAEAGEGSGGDFNRIPGLVLTALVTAAGLWALRSRFGAVATAGSVATVLGIPALAGFALVSDSWAVDSVLGVSVLGWGAVYLVGPGRGRPVFLGAGLFGAWALLLELVEGGFAASFSFFPFGFFAFGTAEAIEQVGEGFGYGPMSYGPDLGAVAVLSIGVGLAYLLLSRRLDQRGRHGIATPVLVAAVPALLQGAVAFVIELESVRAAVIVAAVGLLLAVHGATVHRRVTTWLGAAVVVAGLGVTLADLAGDVEVAGVLLALAGLGVVAGAQLLGDRLGEPDEMAVVSSPPPPAG